MLKAVRGPLIPFMLFATLLPVSRSAAEPPAPTPASPTKSPFFSGFVAEVSATSITVTRKGTGKELLRRVFIRDDKTKVEGNLKAGARVTVRYDTSPAGDHAARIIVR